MYHIEISNKVVAELFRKKAGTDFYRPEPTVRDNDSKKRVGIVGQTNRNRIVQGDHGAI